MVLELYYDALSQPSRAVYLLLKGSGVKFDPQTVDILKGEHLTPKFAKKNPIKRVPVLNDGGFFLTESVAMMRYITAANNLPDHWYPRADPKKQARVDEFLNWHHFGLRKPCVDLFLALICSKGIGGFPKQDLDAEKVKVSKEGIQKAVADIADYFLQDRLYITGDEISAADILGAMELIQLYGAQEEALYESNARVKAWMKRIGERLKPHFDESLSKVKAIRKMHIEAKK